MAEIFVNINFDSNYQISNFGNVKHIESNRIVPRSANGLTVKLNNWSGPVRILVADAFVEKINGGYIVESIDGNAFNLNALNLRWKPLKNCITRTTHKNNSSGIVGVFFNQCSQKWRAQITINKKRISLGDFINKGDAMRARQEAEVLYFQEYRAVEI